MNYDIQINNLFPIPVAQINVNYQLTEDLLLFIKKQEITYNYSNYTSKNKFILDSPELLDLKTIFNSIVKEFVTTIYNPKYGIDFYITQSWINYSSSMDSHHRHSHPNSILSGVYYIENSNTDTGKIHFYNNNYRQLYLEPKEYNVYNTVNWWFNGIPGQLLLFPSHLTHDVEAVNYNETRISLSFNTFARGMFGDNDALTGLSI
jgi:uncharacterized protein (TIGR02466 family)